LFGLFRAPKRYDTRTDLVFGRLIAAWWNRTRNVTATTLRVVAQKMPKNASAKQDCANC